VSSTASESLPFGNLPYPDSAYPDPTSNLSSSEESEVDDQLTSDINDQSIYFRLSPAVWTPKELRGVQQHHHQESPQSNEMAVPVIKMPGRNHHSAPKFDGKPTSLSPFLDEVDQLAESCGLTPKQTIEWVIRYAPSDERELWQMQESVGTDEWEKFKKELFELYPGSTGERKYSISNLQSLIEKQSTIRISDADDFGAYRRSFLTVATYLKNKTRLTEREISIYFLQGLQLSFRDKVQAQLKAENPKHHSDDPYSLVDISTAALFVLSCDHTDYTRKEEPSAKIKKETFDLSPTYDGLNLASLAEEVAKRINTLEKQQTSGGPNLPRLRTHQCLFCSDSAHYLNGCPKAAEYIQKGLCQKNADGFIVLPNGNRISTRDTPGKNLKERLDNWHKANGTPQVSTNFVGASNLSPEYGWSEENTGEITSEREREDIRTLENLVASTQKKIDGAKRRIDGKKQERGGMATRSKPHQEKEPDKTEGHTNVGPQFRYVTPIEDPSLIKKIAQQSLDLPITMTTRELLSVAPDVRRHIKEQLMTKRVSTTALIETTEAEDPTQVYLSSTDNLIVANHVEELRVIDVLIQGVEVVATVDDGSQILSIRQDVWEKLGLPIRSDKIMVMESANKSKDETMGLLQDLKLKIGEYDFYVQVQVVKDAPYELLLGRPFLTLTQASHKHFSNGDSRLTLTDPNTRDTITIPTRCRKRVRVHQDFQ
jgi:hypothetical protein